jgi:hypothetical protein
MPPIISGYLMIFSVVRKLEFKKVKVMSTGTNFCQIEATSIIKNERTPD